VMFNVRLRRDGFYVNPGRNCLFCLFVCFVRFACLFVSQFI
jgi:hypothetical protein